MFIKPDLAQGHLPMALQESHQGGLEELFSLPIEKAPLPGDIVYIPDKKNPKELRAHVVIRRYFSPFGYGMWNVQILARPLTEEEKRMYDCELFGIEKWPETEEEIRAFEAKFVAKSVSQG